ncbi:MAG: vitamin K epoxide reductase family protein, partial [Propionibacteriaceae bacterium]
LGFLFAYWLFYEAMFNIGALCPWCLLVTLSTTLVFASLTRYNIRHDNLYLPPRAQTVLLAAQRMALDTLVVWLWLTFLVAAIVLRYGTSLFA